MHYAVIEIKVTSMRIETAQCRSQLGSGEAKFPGWEDFPKMAKYERVMES